MAETRSPDRSGSLQGRIDAARAELAPDVAEPAAVSGMHVAWRMVIDLVAGVGVGAALGYGLDGLFGVRPFLMATCTLLGFAAGVNLMLRTARELTEQGKMRPADEQDGE